MRRQNAMMQYQETGLPIFYEPGDRAGAMGATCSQAAQRLAHARWNPQRLCYSASKAGSRLAHCRWGTMGRSGNPCGCQGCKPTMGESLRAMSPVGAVVAIGVGLGVSWVLGYAGARIGGVGKPDSRKAAKGHVYLGLGLATAGVLLRAAVGARADDNGG